MKTYLHSYENPDKHGIDEDDAHRIVRMLQKEYPLEQFSCGFEHDVLGIRIEGRHMDEPEMLAYRAFVRGALATRNLWER